METSKEAIQALALQAALMPQEKLQPVGSKKKQLFIGIPKETEFQENIFHTKMMARDFDLDDYLFGNHTPERGSAAYETLSRQLQHEMLEIYYGRNMPA